MTVTPKLQKGLKRLFSSSVMRIIAALLLVASVIAMLVGLFVVTDAVGGDELTDELARMFTAAASGDYAALNESVEIIGDIDDLSGAAADAVASGAVILVAGVFIALAAGILIIIAWIMSLVGVVNVSKENSKFKVALYAVLAGIALSILSGIISKGDLTTTTIFSALSSLADITMFLFICDGVRVLGEKLAHSDFLGKYNTIVVIYALAAVLKCVGGFLGVTTVGYILQLIGNVCSIVSFILYLSYLRKAIKAVEGVPVADQY